jgi:hypothetical protein
MLKVVRRRRRSWRCEGIHSKAGVQEVVLGRGKNKAEAGGITRDK